MLSKPGAGGVRVGPGGAARGSGFGARGLASPLRAVSGRRGSETSEDAFGLPLVMLTLGGPDPLPLPTYPLGLPGPPLLPPVMSAMPVGEPAGTPGLGPSGEIENRAARFPAGRGRLSTLVEGGAGVGESATSRCTPESPVIKLGPMSGAGPTSCPVCRGPTRGTDVGAMGSHGFGIAAAFAEMLSGPTCFSRFGTSGTGISDAGRMAGFLGRSLARASRLIWSRGRVGWAASDHWTMLGIGGRIFGGSGGASGRINVCRGCDGRRGAEMMVCRGWNASAPRGGKGLSGCLRTVGLLRGTEVAAG